MVDERKPSIDVEALYRRYGPMVLRRCRRLLKNEEGAVDAMQEVFVRLLDYRERLHGLYPSSLLFRMATNVCLNVIRAEKGRFMEESETILLNIASYEEPEKTALARVILDRLFLREKPSTREIATLHFIDGFTLKEVAQEMGLSVSGVRKRIRQFRDRAQNLQEV